MTKIASSALIAAAAMLSTAAPAQPASNAAAQSASIRHSDLDISTPAGLATFRGRAKAAANRLCGTVEARLFEEAQASANCRAQLMRSAEQQLASSQAAPAGEVAGTR
jgi:UrcA family protein